ncbi:unnamed protein product, partial [Heterosigma akashiwo]
SIPNLFKKIKSGMYSLPSHLNPLTRDLIPKMLVVDPMKRITMAETRAHPWFQQNLPQYLRAPPNLIEKLVAVVDEGCVAAVARAGFPGGGLTRARAAAGGLPGHRKDLRVAYELFLEAKTNAQRVQETALARQQGAGEDGGGGGAGGGRPLFSGASGQVCGPRTPSPAAAAAVHPGRRRAAGGGRAGPRPTTPARRATGAHAGAKMSAFPQQRRRRWYLGIQSKKEPAHVMTEVYRALQHLNCEWKMVNSYRIKVRWKPNAHRVRLSAQPRPGPPPRPPGPHHRQGFQQHGGGLFASLLGGGPPPATPGTRPGRSLSLYKVQQHIYLLDFQKAEGDAFSFMELAARIITQLKALSAQSKQLLQAQLAAQQQELATLRAAQEAQAAAAAHHHQQQQQAQAAAAAAHHAQAAAAAAHAGQPPPPPMTPARQQQ